MSHEISFNAAGEAEFAYVGAAPWHGLGFDRGNVLMSPHEALEAAKITWEVEQRPVLFLNDSNEVQEIPNRVVNLRSDDHRPLGIVSSDYAVLQNRTVADFVDLLTNEAGTCVETVGALKEGRRVFWTVALQEGEVVKGDSVRNFLIVCHGHDGLFGFRAFVTRIRVVCQNTLSAALSNATSQVFFSHVGNVQEKIDEVRGVLSSTSQDFAEQLGKWQEMRDRRVLADEVDAFLASVFPVGPAPTKIRERRVQEARDTVRFNYDLGVGADPGNLWGLFNAVTEYTSHQLTATVGSSEEDEIGDTAAESRFNSLIFGTANKINARAYREAEKMLVAA